MKPTVKGAALGSARGLTPVLMHRDIVGPSRNVTVIPALDIMMPQSHHNDVRTTLTLDEDVAVKLAQLSRETGLPFKAIVNETLRNGLSAKQAMSPPDRFQIKARPLGLRAGLSYDNVSELLEEVERRS